jgi:hypothetical protein
VRDRDEIADAHNQERLMPEGQSLTEELLDMARHPESFSKLDLGEMLMVAATEILKLQEFGSARPPAGTDVHGLRQAR